MYYVSRTCTHSLLGTGLLHIGIHRVKKGHLLHVNKASNSSDDDDEAVRNTSMKEIIVISIVIRPYMMIRSVECKVEGLRACCTARGRFHMSRDQNPLVGNPSASGSLP